MPRWTILVVEDDYALQQLYRLEFEEAGLGILQASNGLEACRILLHQHVDLIITDIRMPEAGGEAVMDCVELHKHEVPVIVVSAYPYYEARFREDHRTVAGYFSKPVDFKDLIAHVIAYLESRDHLSEGWVG